MAVLKETQIKEFYNLLDQLFINLLIYQAIRLFVNFLVGIRLVSMSHPYIFLFRIVMYVLICITRRSVEHRTRALMVLG